MAEPDVQTIDFNTLNTHGDDRRTSFERLVYVLFKREKEKDGICVTRFDDHGGDGGAEALSDDGVAIQAKFHTTAAKTSPLWPQVDGSVRQAIKTYGAQLREYRIYAPCHIRGPKVKQKDSDTFEQTWKHHVAKWQQWYRESQTDNTEKPHTLKFLFIGTDDMLADLLRPEMQGIREYWFSDTLFSLPRLHSLFEETQAELGVRYRPERHLETSCQRALMEYCDTEPLHQAMDRAAHELETQLVALCALIEKDWHPILDLKATDFMSLADDTALPPATPVGKLQTALDSLRIFYAGPQEGLPREQRLENMVRHGKVERLLELLQHWTNLLWRYRAAKRPLMLLTGPPGIGKSHLLGAITAQLLQQNQPALMVLGGSMKGGELPEQLLLRRTEWRSNIKGMFAAMEAAAMEHNRTFILLIDAVNESENPAYWKEFLTTLPHKLQRHPHLKCIISCKSEYQDICLPAELREPPLPDLWQKQELSWNGTDTESLIRHYFRLYNIRTEHVLNYVAYIRTPLELNLFCETYRNQTPGENYPGLIKVFDTWFSARGSAVAEAMDIYSHDVTAAVDAIALHMWEKNAIELTECDVIHRISTFSPTPYRSTGLYQQLLGHGILHKSISGPHIYVRFSYELLTRYMELEAIYRRATSQPDYLNSNLPAILEDASMLPLLALRLSEHSPGTELPLLYTEPKERIRRAYLQSLKWRSPHSITPQTHACAMRVLAYMLTHHCIEEILRCLLLPGHPLNAAAIRAWLQQRGTISVQALWHIPLACHLSSHPQNLVRTILRNIDSSLRCHNGQQQELNLHTLGLFCGSLLPTLRDKATHILADLLLHHPHLWSTAWELLGRDDDAYVRECMMAAMAKAALSVSDSALLHRMSAHITTHAAEHARTSLSCRRYAELIIAKALSAGAITKQTAESYRMRFRGEAPLYTGLSDEDIRSAEQHKGWQRILDSTQTEEDGLYGDFGRYIMTPSLTDFRGSARNSADSHAGRFYNFKHARRILLQLIRDAGWAPELFCDFEYRAPLYARDLNGDINSIERVGKKYQHIALDTLLASLEDHYERNYPISYGRLRFELNDIRFLNSPKTEQQPISLRHSALSELRRSMKQTPRALPNAFRHLDIRDVLLSRFGESGEECLLLGGNSHDSHLWGDAHTINDIRSTASFGCRCWLVRAEDLADILQHCQQKGITGSGFLLSPLYEQFWGLYPGCVAPAHPDEATEHMWIRTDKRIINAALAVSADGDRISICAPSRPVCDLLQLTWNAANQAFIGTNCLAKPYRSTDGEHEGLYISAAPFIRAAYAAGYIPLLGFWGECHVFDYHHGEHLCNGPIQREYLYRLTEDGSLHEEYNRTITPEKPFPRPPDINPDFLVPDQADKNKGSVNQEIISFLQQCRDRATAHAHEGQRHKKRKKSCRSKRHHHSTRKKKLRYTKIS